VKEQNGTEASTAGMTDGRGERVKRRKKKRLLSNQCNSTDGGGKRIIDG